MHPVYRRPAQGPRPAPRRRPQPLSPKPDYRNIFLEPRYSDPRIQDLQDQYEQERWEEYSPRRGTNRR
ncbi:hypothetical protein [Streptomyces luteireticuli]|uniref:hypothetical protein n=1 Tax=Streptomyces luteireticuli TaxID=173858 RepID=UPI00355773B6